LKIKFKHNQKKGKQIPVTTVNKGKKMLVNIGQNNEKCLQACEMLSDIFSQQNSFICQHTASQWIDMCLVSFYIKIVVLQTAVITLPFYVYSELLHITKAFTHLMPMLIVYCA
jgi:hypothetical protein